MTNQKNAQNAKFLNQLIFFYFLIFNVFKKQ
ncbi:hypothetical protein LTSEMIN_0104, partial [Salmonella enterica subsp. enterica serovar Minnesota str. A4-603]